MTDKKEAPRFTARAASDAVLLVSKNELQNTSNVIPFPAAIVTVEGTVGRHGWHIMVRGATGLLIYRGRSHALWSVANAEADRLAAGRRWRRR